MATCPKKCSSIRSHHRQFVENKPNHLANPPVVKSSPSFPQSQLPMPPMSCLMEPPIGCPGSPPRHPLVVAPDTCAASTSAPTTALDVSSNGTFLRKVTLVDRNGRTTALPWFQPPVGMDSLRHQDLDLECRMLARDCHGYNMTLGSVTSVSTIQGHNDGMTFANVTTFMVTRLGE